MKKVLAIANPKSGRGKGVQALKRLEYQTAQHDCEVEAFITQKPGDARERVSHGSLDGIDAIVSVGGDGTLNEVVHGLRNREDSASVPVGILPCGTGNSLMKDLGCDTPEEAMADLFSGKRFEMDVFDVELDGEHRVGFNMLGFGFPAEVNRHAEAVRVFKRQRYNVGILLALFTFKRQGVQCTLEPSGTSIFSDFVLISNTRHIGNAMRVAPEAELDDGLLNFMALTTWKKRTIFSLLAKLAKGTHMHDERITQKQVSSFEVCSDSPSVCNLDGDPVIFQQVKVRVVPRCITLMHTPAHRRSES